MKLLAIHPITQALLKLLNLTSIERYHTKRETFARCGAHPIINPPENNITFDFTNAASIKEEGQAVLPGKLFTELIRKMPVGDVNISVTDRRSAVIRCMKNRSSLSIMNADEYPEFQELQAGSVVKIPQNKLRDMISRVSFAIATDESRQILTGSLLEVSRSEARLVALDGFRLAMQKLFQPFELPDGVEVVKAIIPGRVINELSRILPDDDAFCNMLINNLKSLAVEEKMERPLTL